MVHPAMEDVILLYHECAPGHVYLGAINRKSRSFLVAFGGTREEAALRAADYLDVPVDILPPFTTRHSGTEDAVLAEEVIGERQAMLRDFIRDDYEASALQRRIIEKRGW